jgi:hypothetical protein
VAFGDTVVFAYQGAVADAQYRIRATFLSEHQHRTVSVAVGQCVLEAKLGLPDQEVVLRAWDVPAAEYQDGKLTFAVAKVSGPNAVVSEVEVLSDHPAKLQPQVPPGAELPRLTPPPVRVTGMERLRLSLNGTWAFCVAPGEAFPTSSSAGAAPWADIQVPGEWAMQGFTVAPGTAAGYRRTFERPETWGGQRVKLRCDAVYSDCTVWLNGKRIGGHQGGFTPFELDVTDAVQPGRNTIALSVKNASLADTLASGTAYAAHVLGGITRNIYLFAVPGVHIARLQVTTDLDAAYQDAVLHAQCLVANEGTQRADGVHCRLTVAPWTPAHNGHSAAQGPGPAASSHRPARAPSGSVHDGQAALDAQVGRVDSAGETAVNAEMSIRRPLLWDPEHPNLYVLRAELIVDGKMVEVVEQRFGFREVEVRGNQLFVNGTPVKLRGVCRHEVHPLHGRSLPPGQWREDVEIFRQGNCNFIRTSHYPPAEEFLNACDELGMFVEDEAPFCWAKDHRGEALHLVVKQTLEMVERDMSHPCVLFWSLANESEWGASFSASSRAVRQADPSRPQIFSYGQVDLASRHYPGPRGPDRVAGAALPTIFDEYAHLNAYNRFELVTDPGIRDAWGQGMAAMWEQMRLSRGCLGGALWAAIDDAFAMPDGSWVGYGTWGPIDGWRRLKPEFWHMKKAYSPVRVKQRAVARPEKGDPITIEVENRFTFSDMKECAIDWATPVTPWGRVSEGAGDTVEDRPSTPRHPWGTSRLERHLTESIPAGTSGRLVIPVQAEDLAGKALYLRFSGPRGTVVDEYLLPIGETEAVVPPRAHTPSVHTVAVEEDRDFLTVTAGEWTYRVSRATGQVACGEVLLGGPHLMLLPLNGGGGKQMTGESHTYAPYSHTCRDWTRGKVEADERDGTVEIKVTGRYTEAEGAYSIRFTPDGSVQVTYDFVCLEEINPRQVGVVFDVPKACDTLAWVRDGQWTFYPAHHIGRRVGRTRAFEGVHLCGPAGPRVRPHWPWLKDGNELGSNDFRSTKESIRHASLTAPGGHGVKILSDGSQHARAWMEGEKVRLLVADYTNPGAERFFRVHAQPLDRPLKRGDQIAGRVMLRPLGP